MWNRGRVLSSFHCGEKPVPIHLKENISLAERPQYHTAGYIDENQDAGHPSERGVVHTIRAGARSVEGSPTKIKGMRRSDVSPGAILCFCR